MSRPSVFLELSASGHKARLNVYSFIMVHEGVVHLASDMELCVDGLTDDEVMDLVDQRLAAIAEWDARRALELASEK